MKTSDAPTVEAVPLGEPIRPPAAPPGTPPEPNWQSVSGAPAGIQVDTSDPNRRMRNVAPTPTKGTT